MMTLAVMTMEATMMRTTATMMMAAATINEQVVTKKVVSIDNNSNK
jgi:hypothetical protein